MDFNVHLNHVSRIGYWAAKHRLALFGSDSINAADTRNKLTEAALEADCTHLLFLDADHILPLDMLDNLLEHSESAMVSGVVHKRQHPFRQVAFKTSEEDGLVHYITTPLDDKTYEVDYCAFGCTLINVKLLKKHISEPYFRDSFGKKPDGKIGNLRSDFNLCRLLRASGEKILIDTRVKITHLANGLAVSPDNVDLLRQSDELLEKTKVTWNEDLVERTNHGSSKRTSSK